MTQLILASSSPRRMELLQQGGITFKTKTPNVDEESLAEKNPEKLVEQLAQLKGLAIPVHDDEVVLSADTVVSFNEQVLTKPQTEKDAYDMLAQLRGNIHNVYTGVMIRSVSHQRIFSVKTSVEFWNLSDDMLWQYIRTKDPFDKAGAYGIQSQGALLVKSITGDYYNVVGLPISRVVRELEYFGIFPTFTT